MIRNLSYIGLLLGCAALGGGSGAWLTLYLGRSASPPQIVTADITSMTQAFTLDLARQNKDANTIQNTTQKWADDLASRLDATARQNRLVILPKGIGVFGVPDITAQLAPLMPTASSPAPISDMSDINVSDINVSDINVSDEGISDDKEREIRP